MPHVGIFVPPEIDARMTEAGRALPDTDWYVDRLYDFLGELGASVLTLLALTHERLHDDLSVERHHAAWRELFGKLADFLGL